MSDRSQIALLHRLAIKALGAYDVAAARIELVAHGENTTFRVTSPGGQYVLRVHRPTRHWRYVDSEAAIKSVVEWLVALRADTPLAVPEPVRSIHGELTTTEKADGVDGSRVCSLLRWMKCRNHNRSARPVHLHRLGAVLAQLHNHAVQWRVPDGFARIRWDDETYSGNTMVYGDIDAADAWKLLPADLGDGFARVAEEVGHVMQRLGQGPDVFGLIHADAHLDNALEDYARFEEAFEHGYTQHRPLPSEQMHYIDAFIAAREVAFGLWLVGMAETHASFRAELAEELGYIERSLSIVLGSTW